MRSRPTLKRFRQLLAVRAPANPQSGLKHFRNDMRLSGKTVLITGASKGIGRVLALGCAREGADVILNYNSDRAGAESAAAEIERLGRRALTVRADLSRVGQIDRMFAQVRRQFVR